MKAIVVRAPWAPLIVQGIKTYETRDYPPAGPMRPLGVRGLPGFGLQRGERIGIVAGKTKADVTEVGTGPWAPLMDPDQPGRLLRPLALGALIGTVVVAAALPVIDASGMSAGDGTVSVEDGLYLTGGALLDVAWALEDDCPHDVSDQLPFGDFTPGRWAWELVAPIEFAHPIPCSGSRGVFELPAEIAGQVPS